VSLEINACVSTRHGDWVMRMTQSPRPADQASTGVKLDAQKLSF